MGRNRTKGKKRKPRKGVIRDKHLLYTAAVQSVDADLDFFERIYKKERGGRFQRLREDFCGTAALACDWVRRREENRAWGIDLHEPTLEWGRKRYVSTLGAAAERVRLVRANVLDVVEPKVDVVAALNFSYSVFKTRPELTDYFSAVRRSLLPEGVFVVDAFGGTDAGSEDVERRRIEPSVAPDGTHVPAFTYVWEQKSFNPVDHHIVCNIHFKPGDGTTMKRAFHYDWRLWTLPELREIMVESGFDRADVYVEGWDDDEDESDGIFRRRTRFENQSGWVAYVVGLA